MKREILQCIRQQAHLFHQDESGIAMTEYIIVFTAVSMASIMAIIWTAAYVKAYRDFLLWWLAHPAV